MYDSIEVFIDFPQQDSYDTTSQTNTYHICTLDREGPAATKKYTGNAGDMLQYPAMWQKWAFKNKPSHIVMRPEVLQQKNARIRLSFVGSNLPIYNNTANYAPGQYDVTVTEKILKIWLTF